MLYTQGLNESVIISLNYLVGNSFPIIGIQKFYFQRGSLKGRLWIDGPCFNMADAMGVLMNFKPRNGSEIEFDQYFTPTPVFVEAESIENDPEKKENLKYYLHCPDPFDMMPDSRLSCVVKYWKLEFQSHIKIQTDKFLFDPNVVMHVDASFDVFARAITRISGTATFEVGKTNYYQYLAQQR
jgi:hypothetical protein